jgi:hypothetical protein
VTVLIDEGGFAKIGDPGNSRSIDIGLTQTQSVLPFPLVLYEIITRS